MDRTQVSQGPPDEVLEAFGVVGPALPIDGGQGASFRADDLVLKTSCGEETDWVSDLVSELEVVGCRIAEPVRAGDGSWEADGWAASVWVPGETWQSSAQNRMSEILEVCDALHDALAEVARPPSFILARTHRWARSDRMVWGEELMPPALADDELVAGLREALRSVELPAQLIHGDMAGNVLFHEGTSPTVIDLSVYWRPAAYARAVAVVDGLLWYGATNHDARAEADAHDPQLLVRAALFRLLVDRLRGGHADDSEWPKSYAEVAALVLALL